MFKWFKNSKDSAETYQLPAPTEYPDMPKVVEPAVTTFDNSDAEYTVGLNQAGHTQLRVKLEYGSATLTMQPGAVKQLIRQLKATLEEETE